MFEDLKLKKKVVGTKQTLKSLKLNNVEKVYLAKDASVNIVQPIEILANQMKVPVIYVPTKKELGEFSGIEISSAAVAILK